MRRTLLAALLGAWTLLCAGVALASPPIPTTALIFSDDFSAFDRATPANPKGRWQTMFSPFASQNLALGNRELQNEQEVYVEPEFGGVACNLNPHTGQPILIYGRAGRVVDIDPVTKQLYACYTQPATPALGINPFQPMLGGGIALTADLAPKGVGSLLWGKPYTSGLLTTRTTFSILYGCAEIVFQSQAGKGLWPAFWMLRADGVGPAEIDVTEEDGANAFTVYESMHSNAIASVPLPANTTATGNAHSYGAVVSFNLTQGYHARTACWSDREIVWYVDNVEMHREATPADLHSPMYLLANLAVGGAWFGYPDNATPFPAQMRILSVKVWSIPTGPIPPASLPVGAMPAAQPWPPVSKFFDLTLPDATRWTGKLTKQ